MNEMDELSRLRAEVPDRRHGPHGGNLPRRAH